jgi:hypothetical protein
MNTFSKVLGTKILGPEGTRNFGNAWAAEGPEGICYGSVERTLRRSEFWQRMGSRRPWRDLLRSDRADFKGKEKVDREGSRRPWRVSVMIGSIRS